MGRPAGCPARGGITYRAERRDSGGTRCKEMAKSSFGGSGLDPLGRCREDGAALHTGDRGRAAHPGRAGHPARPPGGAAPGACRRRTRLRAQDHPGRPAGGDHPRWRRRAPLRRPGHRRVRPRRGRLPARRPRTAGSARRPHRRLGRRDRHRGPPGTGHGPATASPRDVQAERPHASRDGTPRDPAGVAAQYTSRTYRFSVDNCFTYAAASPSVIPPCVTTTSRSAWSTSFAMREASPQT